MQTTRRALGLSSLALAAVGANATAQPKVKPMHLLILGGTGFIGPHQVRYALSRGHKVTVFNRGRRPDDFPPEVEELVGDRNTGDLKSLEGKTWDACIDNPSVSARVDHHGAAIELDSGVLSDRHEALAAAHQEHHRQRSQSRSHQSARVLASSPRPS